MSLLKVSLCINRPKQRHTQGEGFMLRFSSDEGLFSSYGGLLLLFLYVEGPFCYVFLLVWGLFHNVGAFFAIIFSMWGDFFVFMGDFMFLWFFYGLAPSPYNLFCGHMLLCNFHPMFSAITYSGHYVPNKAHCNTRVQFTITMK